MYIKPIPLNLLCDSIDLIEVSKDSMGVETIISTVTLNNVRIIANNNNTVNKGYGIKQKNTGDVFKEFNYKLFYDKTNSSGLIDNFKLNGILIYNGLKLYIGKIVEYKSDNKIHHYEIGLM